MENLMLKSLLLTVMAVAIAAGVYAAAAGRADQSNAKLTILAQKTTPVSGKQMYGNYCAPCHGVNGRGNGSIAAALKTPPADLTVLSRNNEGRFPSTHITAVLQYGVRIPSHGTAEMPVWGAVLGKMDQANNQERLLRISNLSRYLETIQVK
jgi:mono/diheme cytochrome c family protein